MSKRTPLSNILSRWGIFSAVSFILFYTASAATNAVKKPGLPAESTPSPKPSVTPIASKAPVVSTSKKTKQLWDTWYTVSIGGILPYGYYHDKVEEKDGKMAFQNQYWKKEEGFLNEEQLVSFSENSPALTPLLFSFKSTYRGSTIDIDGTFNGKNLSVKIRKDKADSPKIERSISSGVFLSSQFPIWIGKNISRFKPGKRESFSAILEDNVDRKYQPVSGHLVLSEPNDYAKKTSTQKIDVEYNDQKSVWYVYPSGETNRIEIQSGPGTEILVQKASEAEARRFLIEK
jgi:hypothetical protein